MQSNAKGYIALPLGEVIKGFTMKSGLLTAALFAALVLPGCAGRDAQPVAISQAHDSSLKCDQIKAEINANNQKLEALADEHDLKIAQNVVAGVAGAFTLGLTWFALDAKGAAKQDAEALSARNKYLAELASSRCRR